MRRLQEKTPVPPVPSYFDGRRHCTSRTVWFDGDLSRKAPEKRRFYVLGVVFSNVNRNRCRFHGLCEVHGTAGDLRMEPLPTVGVRRFCAFKGALVPLLNKFVSILPTITKHFKIYRMLPGFVFDLRQNTPSAEG